MDGASNELRVMSVQLFLPSPAMPRYQSMLTAEFVRSDAWLGAAFAMQVWELMIHVIDEVEYVWK